MTTKYKTTATLQNGESIEWTTDLSAHHVKAGMFDEAAHLALHETVRREFTRLGHTTISTRVVEDVERIVAGVEQTA